MGASSIGPSSITPALLTSTSRRPELGVRAATNAPRLLLLAHVGGDRHRAPAVGEDALGERLDAIRAASRERDRGARAGARQRGGLADAGGGAGDGDHLAG